jgi:hypothetical protein
MATAAYIGPKYPKRNSPKEKGNIIIENIVMTRIARTDPMTTGNIGIPALE